jgi:heme o synthase
VFVHKAWALARNPGRATAMSSFFASLLQLSLVLAGASVDGLFH